MKRLFKILVSTFILSVLVLFSPFYLNVVEIETHNKLDSLSASYSKGLRGDVKNIAIFIEFADSDANVVNHLDDPESVSNANKIFNSDAGFEMDTINGLIKVPSFKSFYERESYGSLSITTEIFPKTNGRVESYKDIHPIGYYLRYNESNTIGYKDNYEAHKREAELVENAILYVAGQIESSGISASELDVDSNGVVDAISFIIEGQKDLPSSISWNDLLWSHKRDNNEISRTILGKKVSAYNLIYADDYKEAASLFSLNRGTYGTLIHEFGHTLGFMDLYRYGDSASKPVGFYDTMGNIIGSNPQGFLTYFMSEYHPTTNWHNPIPVIDKTTNGITLYKPKYVDKDEKRAIKIKTSNDSKEYFIVEYHSKMNTYSSYSADTSGIIVYRVNDNNKFSGNASSSDQGKNDHIYVFRPNETGIGDSRGDLTKATLNLSRPSFGKTLDLSNKDFDNKTIFFSDGSNSGIQILVKSETSESVTFDVIFPEFEGDGSASDPYVIGDVETFLHLMSLDTKGKYYQLAYDLDFKDLIDYPSINFEGNFDGNNRTIRNLTTNSSGFFNFLGTFANHTTVQNINFENLTVKSNKDNYLGGFAGAAENVTLKNIRLKSGSVKKEGTSLNDLVSVGGFVGNVNNSVIIENCSSNMSVEASQNVGGLIGINQNAKIKDSFATGTINGNSNVGGIIGIQAITDNVYNIPVNVYFSNNAISGVGGYAIAFHRLDVLDSSSLSIGIGKIDILEKVEMEEGARAILPISITPSAQLSYTVVSEDSSIIKYSNGQLLALNVGETEVYVDFIIGNGKMRLSTTVLVGPMSDAISEEKVLQFLGLKKNGKYLTGFTLGSDIEKLKEKISSIMGVSLQSFKNSSGQEIGKGIIATGMTFTLNFANADHNYIVVIKGDVNGDGLIYATDYVKVKNHIMGKSSLNGAYLIAADINSDGNIYATDYVLIKNHIMGKSEISQR